MQYIEDQRKMNKMKERVKRNFMTGNIAKGQRISDLGKGKFSKEYFINVHQ